MKTGQLRALAFVAFIAFAASAFSQQSLWLTHDASWRVDGKELVIDIETITNPTGEESGPMFLAVYAQSSAAYEGGAPGQLIGRAPIDSIPANGRVDNVTVRTKARAPKGIRFTALMLEQQNGKAFEIIDWVAFTSQYAFPKKHNGGVGSDDTAIGAGNSITVTDGAFALNGRKAGVTVGKILNQREMEVTGRIRFTLLATTDPYTVEQEGQVLASTFLGQLAPGDYFHNIQAPLNIKAPKPIGAYYVSLVVEEETELGFVPVHAVTEGTPREF